jgi:hypothetical protein
VLVLALGGVSVQVQAQAVSLDPAKMPRIGSVDERFGSYNIEMAEVTGGNFWKPHSNKGAKAAPGKKPVQSALTPARMDPNLYQYRPPIDLSNPRLRKHALGYTAPHFAGTMWIPEVFGTAVFLYGGWPISNGQPTEGVLMTTAVLVRRSMFDGSRELIRPTDLHRGNRIAALDDPSTGSRSAGNRSLESDSAPWIHRSACRGSNDWAAKSFNHLLVHRLPPVLQNMFYIA